MPDDVMIDIRNVTKRYGRRGRIQALRGVTLQIARGRVTAIVGPNGAGKSTLFGVILGFLRPSDGAVTIHEDDPRHYVLDNGIGYMPDRFALPPGWPVGRAINALGQLNGLPGSAIDETLSSFGLDDQRGKKVGELSRGLQQRLGLAHAFAARRELLVLDEPAEGLDPVWRIHLRNRIAEQRNAGNTVLIASHDLAEVERVADHVVILEHGAVKDTMSAGVAARGSAPTYRITLERDSDRIHAIFPDATPAGASENAPEYIVTAANVIELNTRIAALIELGILITSVTPVNALEQHMRDVMES